LTYKCVIESTAPEREARKNRENVKKVNGPYVSCKYFPSKYLGSTGERKYKAKLEKHAKNLSLFLVYVFIVYKMHTEQLPGCLPYVEAAMGE